MHALVAGAGGATARFDRFRAAAERTGARFLERTPPTGSVRLGTVTRGGSAVVEAASAGSRHLAVLGSGLFTSANTASERLLQWHDGLAASLLDGAPREVAVLLADLERETLTLGASAGSHRVFLADVDGGLLVSTQLGLLADALGADLHVDRSYEDFLLGFAFLPDDRTPYRGIRAHPASTVSTWPRGSSRSVSPPRFELAAARDQAEAAARRSLHDTFFEVLEQQAAGHRRHAVLLGGLDSALVIAGLRRLGHEVDAYTFGFDDPRYEQRHAERIASHLGARHTWVKFTPEIIGSDLRRFSDCFNQPAAQPHYQMQTLHASRIIAEHGHDHVFTGDGCDAAFLGYPTVSRRARLMTRLGLLPGPVRKGLLKVASATSLERQMGHVTRIARSVLRSLELPWPARGHLPTQYLDETALDRLRRGRPPPQDETVSEVRLRLSAGLDQLDPVRLAFHGNGLTGQSRSKVEGSVAASGLAHLSPYQHPQLRALAGSLPLELLRPSDSPAASSGKRILIEMVRESGLLPEFVIRMPKQSPTDSPIDKWFAGPLRPLVYRLLSELPFDYDRRYVDEILSPKRAEDFFRNRIALGHHAFQAVGLLCSYATFTGRGS